MAYYSKDLSVLAYANGFALWHYVTPDKAAEVFKPGYFNNASGMTNVGDAILANMDVGGSRQFAVLHIHETGTDRVSVKPLMLSPESAPPPAVTGGGA
jgi:hypothetical protein